MLLLLRIFHIQSKIPINSKKKTSGPIVKLRKPLEIPTLRMEMWETEKNFQLNPTPVFMIKVFWRLSLEVSLITTIILGKNAPHTTNDLINRFGILYKVYLYNETWNSKFSKMGSVKFSLLDVT